MYICLIAAIPHDVEKIIPSVGPVIRIAVEYMLPTAISSIVCKQNIWTCVNSSLGSHRL